MCWKQNDKFHKNESLFGGLEVSAEIEKVSWSGVVNIDLRFTYSAQYRL